MRALSLVLFLSLPLSSVACQKATKSAASDRSVSEAAVAPKTRPSDEREEPALPVLLRLENKTHAAFEDVFVKTTTLRTYGAVPAGGKSDYLPFDAMPEAPHVGVLRDGRYLERPAPATDVETLKIGRYTLAIDVKGGRLTSQLSQDDGIPPRAELTAAFKAADERMTMSLARAYAFLKRADTARCGEEAGATGTAQLAFFVAPSGRTGGAKVLDEAHQGTPLETCLKDVVKRWRLPRYTGAMPPPLVVNVALASD